MLGFHWRRRVERLENHLGLMRLHATWSIPKKVHWSPKSEYGLTTTVLQVLLCKSTLKSAVLLQLKFLGSRCDFLNIDFFRNLLQVDARERFWLRNRATTF